MGFVAAVLLFSFAFAAIVEGDYGDPPKPEISETFSAWITDMELVKQNSSIVIASEVDGYFARDMQGGRKLINGSLLYEAKIYYYSELHLVKQNISYQTIWGTDGIKKCRKMNGFKMRSMWAWTKYAKYFGREFNRDVWVFEDYVLKETWYIGVPANDPTTPMDVQAYSKAKGTEFRTLYSDFDAKYQPADSEFEIPPECQSADIDHSSHFQHIFDHFDRRKQRKVAPSKEEDI